jgi:hypothetical protein
MISFVPFVVKALGVEPLVRHGGVSSPCMDKKEINSPKLTEHFLFWVIGIAVLLLAFLFAHFVYHVV